MIRTLDIFCGAGGSSAGARAAGSEIVAGIDCCPIATGTYAANFPNARVVTSRLEDVDLGTFKKEIGRVDLLLASPECRNHTCARGAAPRDEASRATALMTVNYARAFRPRWLALENVIHMRPWSRFGELKNSLRDLGYHLEEHILNASHFDVPQARRRLFLVGDLKGPSRLWTVAGDSGPGPSAAIHPGRPGNLADFATLQPQESEGNSSASRARLRSPRPPGWLSGRLLRQRWKWGMATSRSSTADNHDHRSFRAG